MNQVMAQYRSKCIENEIAYMNRNKANAFVSHWVGGGGRIVQVAPVNRVQYGCGPKGNPYSYAQVELARTADKEQFKRTMRLIFGCYVSLR